MMINVNHEYFKTSTMSDFELVTHYQRVLQELASVAIALAHVRGEDMLNVSVMGVPCHMEGRQLKQHISMQMNFFERMIEEAQERIVRSEGKVG